MSSFLLEKKDVRLITQAVRLVLDLNKKYPVKFFLDTAARSLQEMDKCELYRHIYTINLEAVRCRYGENSEELNIPDFEPLASLDTDFTRIDRYKLKKACGIFNMYLSQCGEIVEDRRYDGLRDIYKVLCLLYVELTVGWALDFSVRHSEKKNVQISGIIYEHGADDYALWEGFSLSEEDEEAIQSILSKYDTQGYSVRGSRKEIGEEVGCDYV